MSTGTVLILAVLAAVALVALRGSIKRMAHGCCGTSGPKTRKIKVGDRDRSHYPYEARLSIEGMSCQNCALRVENALNSMDGIWAKVNLGKKSALVRGKQPLEEAKLRRAVASAGYQVTNCEM